ncbi:polyprenol phosphomannose-dependent alpha 1,6 mannosyltransferase MptB [Corynebacterium crudilactis]|uniref:Alpha 1,6 mannopyranosyltransferase n=1 Tax=Corynebacterium crudilactis TaxID=1652495 RepID=A0A172QTV5_9CORY|nr:polyprenol phosphomannose-dependent alpha 1,6 mannosyltransferase MptB [Corynebacterium crudilactis]ANE04078.1 alpha 1,6 mannopyranosyltransferase [Corynebacterium crudilactis]
MTKDEQYQTSSNAPQDGTRFPRVPRPLRQIFDTLPRIGTAGSRSATLHIPNEETSLGTTLLDVASGAGSINDRDIEASGVNPERIRKFAWLRLIGTMGALLIAFGALGAGALPVVNNPYVDFPGGNFMGRMLQTSSMIVLIGVGFMALAWVLMAPMVGIPFKRSASRDSLVSLSMLRRTFAAWVAPIMFTAPLFTQDIYSYLAQGSITAQGIDPYSAGPLELLGPDNHLARSVPFIWAQSPSPYGPVSLGIAASISNLTNDSIVGGVFAHRFASLLGVIAAGWAITMLARRCRVSEEASFYLGVLNPLLILHLIGGIHNESILLGFMLVGLEIGLRGADRIRTGLWGSGWTFIALSGLLISCAGLVKVTGFIALGFVGMAIAREFHARGHRHSTSIGTAVLTQIAALVLAVALISLITGIGLGWITSQGGAASIRSWMSITTNIGVFSGFIGMNLGLGDHTDAILIVTRAAGVAVAAAFMVRMLFATYRGHIHPVGALGVATFVLVILFPVVHPWYMLWAIVPLAPWANRLFFQLGVIAYSTAFSFFVLPRGLALPAGTVFSIYFGAALGFAALLLAGWWALRRATAVGLD